MNDQTRQLDPRYVTVQRTAGWIMFAIIMTVWTVSFSLALLNSEDGLHWIEWVIGAAGAILAPLLIWLATAWPALSYRHYSYCIDEQGIEIRSGVFIREVTTVPRSRVQHTDVSQGPIERRYGLGTLVIYTAGTHFARVALPGLEYGMAMWIRDMLLPKHGSDAV
jgi:membrane protein YdbS with pleckstrin-like domain